jgi:hypothetical protein
LLSFNSKLSHVDRNINLNLNLNHKCLSPTWRKPIWSLICGEHSELARQIYGEKLLQRIFRKTRTFVNVAQDLRDFGRFEKSHFSCRRRHSSRNSRASLPAVILINVWVGIVENHRLFENHLVDPCFTSASLHSKRRSGNS